MNEKNFFQRIKHFCEKYCLINYVITFLVLMLVAMLLFFIFINSNDSVRDVAFDSIMAASAVVIPIVLSIIQIKSEKEKEKNEKRNTEILKGIHRIQKFIGKQIGDLTSVFREQNVLIMINSSSGCNSQCILSPAHQSNHLSVRSGDMPKLATFTLCEDITAITNDNGERKTCLTGPKASLSLSCIPGNFSFGIGLGLVNVDWSRDRKIAFEIWSPSGTCVEKSETIEIPDEYANTDIPVAQQNISFNAKVENMNVPEEGNYKFVLFVNGERVGEKSFPVLQASTEIK